MKKLILTVIFFIVAISIGNSQVWSDYHEKMMPEVYTPTLGELAFKKTGKRTFKERRDYFDSLGLSGYNGSYEQNMPGSIYYESFYEQVEVVAPITISEEIEEVSENAQAIVSEDMEEIDSLWELAETIEEVSSEALTYAEGKPLPKNVKVREELKITQEIKPVTSNISHSHVGLVLLLVGLLFALLYAGWIRYVNLPFLPDKKEEEGGGSFMLKLRNKKPKKANTIKGVPKAVNSNKEKEVKEDHSPLATEDAEPVSEEELKEAVLKVVKPEQKKIVVKTGDTVEDLQTIKAKSGEGPPKEVLEYTEEQKKQVREKLNAMKEA